MMRKFDDDRFKNPRPQSFALPLGIITHWLTAPSSAAGLQKLQQTCKYFYSKRKVQFLDYCNYRHNRGYIKHRGYIKNQYSGISFWLTKRLVIKDWKKEENPNRFPDWQIFRCTITILDVFWTKLRIDDYEFITKEGTIKSLKLSSSPIVDFSDVEVSLDFILNKVPNAEIVHYHDFASINFKYDCLKKVNFSSKLKSFSWDIRCSQDDFKPELLLDFMKLNAAPSSTWCLIIWHDIQIKNIKKCIQPWIDSWDTDKPTVEYA